MVRGVAAVSLGVVWCCACGFAASLLWHSCDVSRQHIQALRALPLLRTARYGAFGVVFCLTRAPPPPSHPARRPKSPLSWWVPLAAAAVELAHKSSVCDSQAPTRAGWQLGYSCFRPAAGSLMLRHRQPPIQTSTPLPLHRCPCLLSAPPLRDRRDLLHPPPHCRPRQVSSLPACLPACLPAGRQPSSSAAHPYSAYSARPALFRPPESADPSPLTPSHRVPGGHDAVQGLHARVGRTPCLRWQSQGLVATAGLIGLQSRAATDASGASTRPFLPAHPLLSRYWPKCMSQTDALNFCRQARGGSLLSIFAGALQVSPPTHSPTHPPTHTHPARPARNERNIINQR
jgi:hypothetical protein